MDISLLSRRRSLAIVCLILFLTFLDNTIVSVALGSIQSSLGAGVSDLQWIINGYMLTFAVLMLSGGSLGDRLGQKKVMLGGVAVFVAGSVLSGLAPNVGWLIGGRVVMGIGAAASEPGTLSLIRTIYQNPGLRSRALGAWAAVSGVALAFGPVLGGVLVGLYSWRSVFFFSAGLGALLLLAGWIYLPTTSPASTSEPFDASGLVLGGLAVTSATVGLTLGESEGYMTWWIICLLALAFVMGVLFVYREKKASFPLLPLKLFSKLQFSVANAVAFSVNFAIFGVFFFVALYLEFIAGFSPFKIALAFISITVCLVASAILAGRYSASHASTIVAIAGCVIAAIGTLILQQVLTPSVSAVSVAWPLGITGIGFGMCLMAMTEGVLGMVSPRRSGMAASVVNTFRELGGVFAVAILGSIVNGQLTSSLVKKLTALGLPANFQSFVIYAISHGGHTPSKAHISLAQLAAHASLINTVRSAAYNAFGRGLSRSLLLSASLLLFTAASSLCWYVYQGRKPERLFVNSVE